MIIPSSDRWYLGTDGKYHWPDFWFIPPCGHLEMASPAVSVHDLSTSQCCLHCLMAYFDVHVSIPEATA